MYHNGKRTRVVNASAVTGRLLEQAREQSKLHNVEQNKKYDVALEEAGLSHLFDPEAELKSTFSDRAQRSRYLLTINTNTSLKTVDNVLQAKRAALKLVQFKPVLHAALANGTLLKPITGKTTAYSDVDLSQWRAPQLTEMQYFIERGTQKSFIHAHSYVEFCGLAHIRTTELQQLAKQFFAPEFKNVYINVRYISDGISNVMEYVKKQYQRVG